MASGIASHVGRATPIPKRKAAKDKDYLAFIKSLPSVLSRQQGVEVCHVSYSAPHYGAYGRGKGSKASDRWVLPMTPNEHRRQHDFPGGEREFWREARIDPHLLCLIIYGLYNEAGRDAFDQVEAIIMAGEFHGNFDG